MTSQNTNFADVVAFHEKFAVPVLHKPGFLKELNPDVQSFREKFLQEELDEFKDSVADGDLITAFDSLIDEVYVAMGTAALMGCSAELWQQLWTNVQEANMSKVAASSATASKRGYAGDIVKPAGWVGPDVKHKQCLENAGYVFAPK